VGTSRNDPSPKTPPWRMALAVVGTPDINPTRQGLEIWKAVAADRGEKLVSDFASPALAEACRYVAEGIAVHDALARYDRSTLHESGTGLALEMGRRAMARCAAQRADAATFVGELFAEAVSYYASRDLPSFVAAEGRVANTSSSIDLKDRLRQTTREQVRALGTPRLTPRGWKSHITRVVRALQTEGRTP
jgi:hypothetical protein